ncbi:alpha/beta hydrolase family protein [Streptomyces sp. S.PNR 29]|uniref:alpha/beta hydrolase n=1 Tax=Streptomyces sp. S.PNR 29 TaxID=2973805 RepID=UPI0025B01EE4|nr:alpha/beta hydrolase family protein [Streptomyces sp. S.PNR 29]MDN0196796.1 esterase family protein [Streptomyces sp. S.PNR 29]
MRVDFLMAGAFTGRARRGRRSLLVCLMLLPLLCGAGTASAARAAQTAPRSPGTDAQITDVRELDERTLDLTVSSPAVGALVPVRVILPRSWHSDPESRFPVVYLLHGGNDDYTSWTRETDVEELAEHSDALIVMPDAGKAGYYSDWYAGRPRWETFHTAELVRLMERTFRASSARAVIGLSMGGFGALNYAAHHQGMYRYVASMSSYVDLDGPAARVALGLGSLTDGVDLRDVWGDPVANADVWRDHNPAAMPHAFRGAKVHLSVGDGKPGPWDENRPVPVLVIASVGEKYLPESIAGFAASLRSAGVEVTTHFYSPGTHSWPYWERELHLIWPTVMKELT